MARITADDCLKTIPNRFDVILAASKRARRLILGSAEATVPTGNDKATVTALREIAAGTVDMSILKED